MTHHRRFLSLLSLTIVVSLLPPICFANQATPKEPLSEQLSRLRREGMMPVDAMTPHQHETMSVRGIVMGSVFTWRNLYNALRNSYGENVPGRLLASLRCAMMLEMGLIILFIPASYLSLIPWDIEQLADACLHFAASPALLALTSGLV